MTYKIAPYSHGSKSANVLKTALGALFLKKSGSEYTYKKGDVVINWGSPYGPKGMPCLNGDNNIVRDKLVFFKTVAAAGLSMFLPPYATGISAAASMKFPVFCRTEVDGHDGSGIVIAKNEGELVKAPLYTSYIKQTQEYRVHVGKQNGKAVIIHVQRKAKLNASTDPETMVRTGGHGYILAHNNFTAPDVVLETAKKVFMACNLDFGGCDVVYNEELNRAFVLEINTAPELSGPSVEKYKDFFTSFHKDEEVTQPAPAANSTMAKKPEGSGTGGQNPANSGVGSLLGANSKPSEAGSKTAAGVGHGLLTGGAVGKPVLGDTAGAAAVVSGGDISGLMQQLEHEFGKKVLKAYNEGFATGKHSVKVPEIDIEKIKLDAYNGGIAAGKVEGAAEYKQKLKELLA